VHRHGQFGFAGQLFLYRLHDVMRHKWLSIVLADVAVGDKARLAAQVARELSL
jgi:hypothetical protein